MLFSKREFTSLKPPSDSIEDNIMYCYEVKKFQRKMLNYNNSMSATSLSNDIMNQMMVNNYSFDSLVRTLNVVIFRVFKGL